MPGPEIRQADRNITFLEQLEADVGPVVLVNVFYVDPANADAALNAMSATRHS